jgi:hypothetical protein
LAKMPENDGPVRSTFGFACALLISLPAESTRALNKPQSCCAVPLQLASLPGMSTHVIPLSGNMDFFSVMGLTAYALLMV